MSNKRKISDDDVERINDLYSRGFSTREIGRELGVSQSTVCNYLDYEVVERRVSRTEGATRARVAILHERIAENAIRSMDDVQNLRGRIYEPAEVVVQGADGAEVVELREPSIGEVSAALRASSQVAAGVERSLAVIEGKSDSAAGSVIDALVSGISSLVERSDDAGVDPRDQDSDYNVLTDPEVWEK